MATGQPYVKTNPMIELVGPDGRKLVTSIDDWQANKCTMWSGWRPASEPFDEGQPTANGLAPTPNLEDSQEGAKRRARR